MKHTLTVNREVSVVKIALCGKLRSGKDEIANHLYIKYGYDRVAFGDALRKSASEVFPWLYGAKKPRALLQEYGQLARQIDPDVWIKHVERKIKGQIDFRVSMGADKIGIIITDLRQDNEYEWACANGFTIVKVTAPGELRIERAINLGDDFTVNDLTHGTEMAIDSFGSDYEIVNDGTIDELKRKVDEVLSEINTK